MNITIEEHRRVVQGYQTELSIAHRHIQELTEQCHALKSFNQNHLNTISELQLIIKNNIVDQGKQKQQTIG